MMRDEAPDILLTNYKMLDQMLLRYEDRRIWQQSAGSLQYLVLDEFHTYDGAQGTDVSMLLRRLGLTLKSHGGRRAHERRRAAARPDHSGRHVGDAGRPGRSGGDARRSRRPCSAKSSTAAAWSPSPGSMAEWAAGAAERRRRPRADAAPARAGRPGGREAAVEILAAGAGDRPRAWRSSAAL